MRDLTTTICALCRLHITSGAKIYQRYLDPCVYPGRSLYNLDSYLHTFFICILHSALFLFLSLILRLIPGDAQ